MSKLLITSMEIHGVPCILTALAADGNILEVRFRPKTHTGILGNIYVAHVADMAENIQSAFVEIGNGEKCYFSLKEQNELIFANPTRHAPLRCGDDIIVQVSRDAMKGKLASVTANINFTGKYLVLTTGKKGLGISSKLGMADRKRLKEWLSDAEIEEYGLVVRTNAKEAVKEEIQAELAYLQKRYEKVLRDGKSRVTRSLIEEAEPFYLSAIRDVYQENLTEILIEDASLYENVRNYLEEYQPEFSEKLRRYEDKLLPLHKLYSIEKVLKRASQEKIWLKSGGFLVIQQTEAFVSIDVNTGKYNGKKKMEETFRKINLEAAAEIAKQARLRNLSGILMIDFMNMESEDHKEELLHVLQKHMKSDPVKTIVVDMTKLNIVEVTRRKVRRPLWEDFQELDEISGEV